MTLFVKCLIVIVNIGLFTLAFANASGSLGLKKLNLYSISYYYMLIFCMIGGSIIFLGFKNQYLIQKVTEEKTITETYFALSYSLIALPICISWFNSFLGVKNYRSFYYEYISKEVDCSEYRDIIFGFCCGFTLIGLAALIYTFVCFGGIPLVDALLNGYSDAARISISHNFSGNQYVKNILAMAMIPILSYIAYIYFKATKEKKWKLLFIFLFALSIVCKTYDLEKAPVVFYICYFYLIDCMMGNIKNLKKAVAIVLFAVVFILLVYTLIGNNVVISLSSGPLSRLLITQIATLFLHVQSFPKLHPFLNGASFPAILGGQGMRSGRVVMGIYYADRIANGTAGVMNSLFVGEAYANFGWIGVIIAPIAVGFVISTIPTIVLKQRKDPINMAIYVLLSYNYATALIGGYVDFFYNAGAIIVIGVLVMFKVISRKGILIISRIDS